MYNIYNNLTLNCEIIASQQGKTNSPFIITKHLLKRSFNFEVPSCGISPLLPPSFSDFNSRIEEAGDFLKGR